MGFKAVLTFPCLRSSDDGKLQAGRVPDFPTSLDLETSNGIQSCFNVSMSSFLGR